MFLVTLGDSFHPLVVSKKLFLCLFNREIFLVTLTWRMCKYDPHLAHFGKEQTQKFFIDSC